MIPSAFKTSKTLVTRVLTLTGLYETPGSLPSDTETIQIVEQYPRAVIAPTSEIPAIEFRLGS